ncbi:Transposon Tf2-9 polyprotein [Golovinomyces cichoracearum]|uniref:Transposon Tf2-9 polyprotein n=1 Tax=Golovinomyces cichoracearum TaxID=62708 RepID=A0A420J7H5_9PEZI|nr:Transposon Tf2-9 polyprotein [Golovinomyces cichoracearum]
MVDLNEDQISSWRAIKVALTSLPVLKQFNFGSIVVIDCDASKVATGGVLLQPHPYKGNTRNDDKPLLSSSQTALYPVAYMIHKFSPTQQKYSTQERELLAVILFLQHWRYWIQGANIVVRTDLESLARYCTKIDVTPRILRFLDVIEHYDPHIVYRKGVTNFFPDYLSRPPFSSSLDADEVYPVQIDNDPDITEDEIDQIYQQFFFALNNHSELPIRLARFKNDFIVRSNSLYFIENKFLKEELDYDALLHQAISLHHWIGHATAGILIAELQLVSVVNQCSPPNIPSLPLQHFPPAQPLQRWGIDFTGPIAGYKMLNAVDYATGYGISQLYHPVDHATIINFIKNLIYTFGTPAELISDNGASFLAYETRQFLDHYKIRYHQTTPYHPRTNGRCEKLNGVIKKILSNILMAAVGLTAEEALKKALLIYNTRPSENGYSQFLLFGVAQNLSNPAPTTFFYTREETQDETKALTKDLASRKKEIKDMIRNSVNSVKA